MKGGESPERDDTYAAAVIKTPQPPRRGSYFRYAPLDHAVAGVTAGCVANVLLHPLDVVKIRLQVAGATAQGEGTGVVPSGREMARGILRKYGLKGLYEGCVPNLTGGAMAWGSYFFAYQTVKDLLVKAGWGDGGKEGSQLGPGWHMCAASVAGSMTLLVTNPVWVIKTRMCLQESKKKDGSYMGMRDAARRILREEGFPGFYRGLVPGLWGVSHGAFQFMAYEELKKIFLRRKRDVRRASDEKDAMEMGNGTSSKGKTQGKEDKELSVPEYLIMAAMSKVFATVTTYPYQVVRSRLQNQRSSGSAPLPGMVQYAGAVDCIRLIHRREGLRGFYRGLAPSVVRVLPSTCVVFSVYEFIAKSLKDMES
eukprot:Nk52_evm83s230 gene=Nk52_evmTU83s230